MCYTTVCLLVLFFLHFCLIYAMGNIACQYKSHMIYMHFKLLYCILLIFLVFVYVIVLFAAIFMSSFNLEFV